MLQGIKNAVPNAEIIYEKACELNEEFQTVNHIDEFNGGQGIYAEFFNNTNMSGKPVTTGYYDEVNFSTFGAYDFAEGVQKENISVRLTGKYVADFTGNLILFLAMGI